MRTLLAVLTALCLFGPALADDAGRIRTIGRAQEERAPDFASVHIGVQTRAAKPAEALDAASKAARGVIESAKKLGVRDADIGTSSITLLTASQHVTHPDGTMKVEEVGYSAGNHVTVRLADMQKLGELMRIALESGANSISSIDFGLLDPDAARASVQVAAMKDARAQAERLADAAGVKLGKTLAITSPPRSEASSRDQPQAFRSSAGSFERKSVPLEAGSITLSAEVDAVFAIER